MVRTSGAFALLLVITLLTANGAGCRDEHAGSERTGHMAGRTIQQVQEDHTDAWMTIPGVVGTAIGQCNSKPCILIFTDSPTEQVRKRIPATVEGYPVVVQYMGEVRAREKP